MVESIDFTDDSSKDVTINFPLEEGGGAQPPIGGLGALEADSICLIICPDSSNLDRINAKISKISFIQSLWEYEVRTRNTVLLGGGGGIAPRGDVPGL